ncbi:hypothetical protein ACLQ2P_39550 [Actinomadura citrea]|uniref:hypothetical protein n=1 Tax=Actinomadura citrea TaxID=46158 RepID=UPI003CE47628
MSPRNADPAAVASPTATGADLRDQPTSSLPQFPTLQDVPQQVALINGGFEEPKITGGNQMLHDATRPGDGSVPGWQTTASDHVIEIWHSRRGVPAASGEQFAELNANESSALYQDLETTPGTTLYWSLRHRGREGDDTMSVKIGRPDRRPNKTWTFTDGTAEWVPHADSYKVPAGQTVTRFAFEAGRTATGNPTVGNFLDDIVFGTAPCVVVTAAAEPESAAVGDTITYTVNLKNHGGIPAENLILRDAVPAGTSYVPGSLKLENGPGQSSGNGWYDSTTGQLTLPLGQGATAAQGGTLPSTVDLPDGVNAQFQVQVEREGAGRTISQQATATYDGARGDAEEHLTSTSNPTSVAVAPAADGEAAEGEAGRLAATMVTDPVSATVGEDVTFHLAVSNHGPAQATGVIVTVQFSADLEFVSAAGTGTYGRPPGEWAIGDLPAGDTAELQLHTTATAPGALSVTAIVTTDRAGVPDRTTHVIATAAVAVCSHAKSACAAHGEGGAPATQTGADADLPLSGDAVQMVVAQARQDQTAFTVCVPGRTVHLMAPANTGLCQFGCAYDGWHEQTAHSRSVLFPAVADASHAMWHGKKGSKKRAKHHRRFLRELASQVHALSRQLAEMNNDR